VTLYEEKETTEIILCVHVKRKGHKRTQKEGSHPQDEARSVNPDVHNLDFRLPAIGAVRK
jgi:hypothetical protein